MNSLLVALCFIGCAFAVVPDPQAGVVRSLYERNVEGGYQYVYETENGISAHVNGQMKTLGKDEVAHQVQGSVSYLSPDGQPIQLSYTADENGYHPTGDHLPTTPAPMPIPDYILRALEYIAAHPYTEKGNSIPVSPPIPELILRNLEYIAAHPPPVGYLKKTLA